MGNQKIKSLRNKIVSIVGGIMIMLTCFSCQQNEIYSQFSEIKNAEWSRDETLYFEIDSGLFKLNIPYEITLEITNRVSYPYQNIWLYVTHNMEDESVEKHAKYEYRLADDNGQWLGAGFGSLYQETLMLKKKFVFKEKRNYTFGISHDMRANPLPGIERLGLRVSRIEY